MSITALSIWHSSLSQLLQNSNLGIHVTRFGPSGDVRSTQRSFCMLRGELLERAGVHQTL
eukprot:5163141-Amphidinium_carterae.1